MKDLIDSKKKFNFYCLQLAEEKSNNAAILEKQKEKGPNKLQSDSLSKQFKKQLDELIKMLGQSNPRYVKCIKPNSEKTCGIFDSLDVNRQLLSAGVLESIKIRKQGYSIRRTHEEFIKKYGALIPGLSSKNPGDKCADLSKEVQIND